MTNKTLPAAALALVAVAAMPAATAHGAAPPLPYMTRLLNDFNDDWLGVQDGHNLIALDAYATFNETLGGDALVLRLIMSGGYAAANSARPGLAEHVTFKVNGKEQELAVHTEDNANFEAEKGFEAVRGPYPQLTADGTPDGERFLVEGLITYRALGAQPGDATTDWFVTGEAGDAEGDTMPQGIVGGYDDPACTVGGPLAEQCVAFNIGTYTLRAPDYYAKVSAPGMVDIEAGKLQAQADLAVSNMVNGTTQAFRIESQPPPGLAVLVRASETGTPSASASFELPASGTANLKLDFDVTGLEGGSYLVPIVVSSNLGGRNTATIEVMVASPPPAPTTGGQGDAEAAPQPPNHDPITAPTTEQLPVAGPEDAKRSPGMPASTALVAVVGILLACRRIRAQGRATS